LGKGEGEELSGKKGGMVSIIIGYYLGEKCFLPDRKYKKVK